MQEDAATYATIATGGGANLRSRHLKGRHRNSIICPRPLKERYSNSLIFGISQMIVIVFFEEQIVGRDVKIKTAAIVTVMKDAVLRMQHGFISVVEQ